MAILIHSQIPAGDNYFKCLLRMTAVIMHEQRSKFNPSSSFIRLFIETTLHILYHYSGRVWKLPEKSSREEIVLIKQVLKEK